LDLLEETAMRGQIKLSSALLTFATALLASTLFLSGCNTAEGVGDDVEEAGDEVEDAVD
jgi:predicted small secreted protein